MTTQMNRNLKRYSIVWTRRHRNNVVSYFVIMVRAHDAIIIPIKCFLFFTRAPILFIFAKLIIAPQK